MKHISTTLYDFLNEEQETLNDNFRKWFGNSKVVGNNGKPLEVYHGSPEEFDEFIGATFFTQDYFNAAGYAGEDDIVYDVYLSIQNPLIVDCKDKKWDDIETPYGTSTREVVSNADTSKYDGIIFLNVKDAWFDDEEYQESDTIYVTFSSNQIKSVDNDGSWDMNDKNIYK